MVIDAGKLIYDGPLQMIKDRFGKFREITFETAVSLPTITLPDSAELVNQEDRKLILRFDRTRTSASKVAANLMNQVEVLDFSLQEPDLSMIVKQIYQGALSRETGTGTESRG
jgi:ABC-2 type transport system ATP-binding protein